MNGVKLLSKITGVLGLYATLQKSDGTSLLIFVTQESANVEQPGANYPQALKIKTWSASKDSFILDSGAEAYPNAGDALLVTDESGVTWKYAVTRNAETSRYWDYKYKPKHYRIKFYTQYEGTQVVLD